MTIMNWRTIGALGGLLTLGSTMAVQTTRPEWKLAMTTQGLGDTKPVVPNTSASGRAQDRRAEIVKQ